MDKVCPHCDGAGKRMVESKHSVTGARKMVSDWCICEKSKIISLDPAFKLLYYLSGDYLDPEKVDPQLVFVRDNLSSSPNLLIKGSPAEFDTFCLHLKGVVLRNRFLDPPPSILACRAIDLLKDYYVQQADGSSPGLGTLDGFDLLAFTLGTKEKNQALASCMTQVVSMRIYIRRPTWVFLPTATLTQCTQEYSEELETMFKESFQEIKLAGTGRRLSAGASSATNISASKFSPVG